MSDILEKNLNVIDKKWPKLRELLDLAHLDSFDVAVEQNTLLVNGIQLTSNYDRLAEAKLQCERIPNNSQIAYLYGVGLGDVPLNLLQRPQIKSLVVCVLNFDLFLHILNVIDHTSWLNDPRVNLTFATQLADVHFPFVALPTELMYCDEASSVVRDRVVVELNHNHSVRYHEEDNQLAQQEISSNIFALSQDKSVGELFNTVKNGRFIIAAAGPTLSDHFDFIKCFKAESSSNILVALDASVIALMNENIIPDIVVSIDSQGQRLFSKVDFNRLKNTALVYFPRISAELLKSWQGHRYCAYSTGAIFKKVAQEYPKSTLHCAGSVIHTATDLAVKMGADEVTFLGADFGFPRGEVYVKGQSYNFTEQYANSEHWVLNGKGEKISTMLNYRSYLRDLERYIETKPHITFINGSDEGAKIAGTKLL